MTDPTQDQRLLKVLEDIVLAADTSTANKISALSALFNARTKIEPEREKDDANAARDKTALRNAMADPLMRRLLENATIALSCATRAAEGLPVDESSEGAWRSYAARAEAGGMA